MKKVFVILSILVVLISPVFCKTSSFVQFSQSQWTGGSSWAQGNTTNNKLLIPLGQNGFKNSISNPFSGAFSFYNQIIIGVVAGALFGLKFAIELLNAVMNEDSNPKGIKRCILRLLFHVGIVSFGSFGILGVLGVAGV